MTTAHSPRIDAHLHVWDLEVSGYDWIPRDSALYATYSPSMASAELGAAGVEQAVLVQAEDTLADTDYLLGVAEQQPWVAGVVGWVQLDEPTRAEQQLTRWGEYPSLCGVRHLVHNDPRPDFLQLPQVRTSLAMVAERGLAFDVPDAWPDHLAGATDLAAAVADLTVVLDHLGKPPVAADGFPAWQDAVRRFAALPNTVAKLSGLHTPGGPHSPDVLGPVWDTALDLFGPTRLMYGGDWPMTVPVGGYAAAWQTDAELLGSLSPSEQEQIGHRTAERVYALRPRVVTRS